MLSTSQLKLSGTACHHITETPASFKSEITSRQLEDARESGCLHIKIVTWSSCLIYRKKSQR